MSEFRGSTSIELVQLQRRMLRTVIVRREEIRQRLGAGANPQSPFLRALRTAVDQDVRRIIRLHAAIRIAFREDQRLRVWWRTMNSVRPLFTISFMSSSMPNLITVPTGSAVPVGVFTREDESCTRPTSSSLNRT
jgi:hypothetical protein